MSATTQHSLQYDESKPYAEFELELEEDEEKAEQLSTSEIREVDEETGIARVQVTEARYWKTFHIGLQCRQPRLVMWQGQEVCLIRLNLTFAVESPLGGKGRFVDAVFGATFVDQDSAWLNPNGKYPASAAAYSPQILAFAPHLYYGPATLEFHERKHSINPTVGDPAGVAKVAYTHEDVCKKEAEFRLTIQGYSSVNREKTIMRWSMRENGFQKSGLYLSFSVSTLVKYHRGRNFAIRFQGSCHTSWSISRWGIGKKDDPVIIRTDRLAPATTSFTESDLLSSTFFQGYEGQFVRKSMK
ncbi:MAG: hypothetical protein LQ350_002913 [Teloschistes chrysophthalmus]|nr:MAG: hypothetical protein LQ350_002913 [Niorma chrysophthalma]